MAKMECELGLEKLGQFRYSVIGLERGRSLKVNASRKADAKKKKKLGTMQRNGNELVLCAQ